MANKAQRSRATKLTGIAIGVAAIVTVLARDKS